MHLFLLLTCSIQSEGFRIFRQEPRRVCCKLRTTTCIRTLCTRLELSFRSVLGRLVCASEWVTRFLYPLTDALNDLARDRVRTRHIAKRSRARVVFPTPWPALTAT